MPCPDDNEPAATRVDGRSPVVEGTITDPAAYPDGVDGDPKKGRFDPGTVVDGRYQLDDFVAFGGMSEVWIATDRVLDVQVIVKFMSHVLTSSGEARTRFEREAKAAARLKSHHVVTMFGHGMHRGVPYIVMELLDGEDLGARLERRGRLDLAEAAELATQMARGIERAHQLGIVHRDLKPANVFLAFIDGLQTVKLLDFGLAKTTSAESGSGLTRTGQVMGTLQYLSPEQAIGDKAIDHRSDLWSFGMILFRAVTGKHAVDATAIGTAMDQIVRGEIPKPSTIAPDLSADVDAFFARALCASRKGRFQSAAEMAEAFARLATPHGGSDPIIAVSDIETAAELAALEAIAANEELAIDEPEAETEALSRPTSEFRAPLSVRTAIALALAVVTGAIAALLLLTPKPELAQELDNPLAGAVSAPGLRLATPPPEAAPASSPTAVVPAASASQRPSPPAAPPRASGHAVPDFGY